MNDQLSYELLISNKLEALPIPDLADAIWSRIEARLDFDLPTDGNDNPPDTPIAPTGLWKATRLSIVVIAAIILILQLSEKPVEDVNPLSVPSAVPTPQTISPGAPPGVPGTGVSGLAGDQDATAHGSGAAGAAGPGTTNPVTTGGTSLNAESNIPPSGSGRDLLTPGTSLYPSSSGSNISAPPSGADLIPSSSGTSLIPSSSGTSLNPMPTLIFSPGKDSPLSNLPPPTRRPRLIPDSSTKKPRGVQGINAGDYRIEPAKKPGG